ncbi:hypothetical protein MUK42_37233 [Musa troglodytarum]|uniref:Uncharacterized protein n=1 Tax=Musa troglodytarum TaxID=320322 RepID=A0A9E7E8S2_9LILI|nr:hypothetical protein MUK42_37233 [Musa troglodytarum]
MPFASLSDSATPALSLNILPCLPRLFSSPYFVGRKKEWQECLLLPLAFESDSRKLLRNASAAAAHEAKLVLQYQKDMALQFEDGVAFLWVGHITEESMEKEECRGVGNGGSSTEQNCGVEKKDETKLMDLSTRYGQEIYEAYARCPSHATGGSGLAMKVGTSSPAMTTTTRGSISRGTTTGFSRVHGGVESSSDDLWRVQASTRSATAMRPTIAATPPKRYGSGERHGCSPAEGDDELPAGLIYLTRPLPLLMSR